MVIDYNQLRKESAYAYEHPILYINELVKQYGTLKIVNVPNFMSFEGALMSLLGNGQVYDERMIPNFEISYLSASANEVVINYRDGIPESVLPPSEDIPRDELPGFPHLKNPKMSVCTNITGKAGAIELKNLQFFEPDTMSAQVLTDVQNWYNNAHHTASQQLARGYRVGTGKSKGDFGNMGCVITSYYIASGRSNELSNLSDKQKRAKIIKFTSDIIKNKCMVGQNTLTTTISELTGKNYILPYNVNEFLGFVPRWPTISQSFVIKPGSMGLISLSSMIYASKMKEYPTKEAGMKLAALLMAVALLVPREQSYFKSKVLIKSRKDRKHWFVPIKNTGLIAQLQYLSGNELIAMKHAKPEMTELGGPDIPYWNIITKYASKYEFDPYFIAAIIHQETGGTFNPKLVSKAGARGLMQLMPGTAKLVGVKDSFDPDQNIRGGVVHLNDLRNHYKTKYHSVELSKMILCAYNAGMARCPSAMTSIKETREYVPAVFRHYNRYKSANSEQGAANVNDNVVQSNTLSYYNYNKYSVDNAVTPSMKASSFFKEISIFIDENIEVLKRLIQGTLAVYDAVVEIKNKGNIPYNIPNNYREIVQRIMYLNNGVIYSTVTLGRPGSLTKHMVAMPRELIAGLAGVQNVSYSHCGDAVILNKRSEKVLLPIHLLGSKEWVDKFLPITNKIVTDERYIHETSMFKVHQTELTKIETTSKNKNQILYDAARVLRLAY